MARNVDRSFREASQIEMLAENDPIFRVNYEALTRNHKYRQLKPCVTKWLIQSAMARERRQAARLEQELYGRATA